ncbi:hypothetical protein LC613_41225 [Nostoc sphaeroides CHAB 2801]|uniref:hypothetical protein n=1 Tax=Nostoc sphaeroides TaxID=446679 RepID=UPI001E61FA82|nr:hypothetical protein [Nostoc sphaeroides]MCC5633842.1 hypothetical protein [Nostoc sphaeroides CHAB 2801]
MLRLKSICVLMLATSGLSLISYPVKAALINFNSQGNITAIKGLQIQDNSYNEPSNIVGLGIMGILTLLISKKIKYKFI